MENIIKRGIVMKIEIYLFKMKMTIGVMIIIISFAFISILPYYHSMNPITFTKGTVVN